MAPVLTLVVFLALSILRPEFLDVPSLLLTLGGSMAVILFSYSPRQLREVLEVSRAVLSEKPRIPREYADELSRLTQLYRAEGLRGLESAERRLDDFFLRRATGMLVDLQREEKICATLERDLSDAVCRHEIADQVLLTLSKTLPAFGLIGTLVGMVLLLRDLYTQDLETLPAALSLAVLTTLYGAVFANVMVAPFAVRLHAATTEKEIRMQLTIDWAMSLVRSEAAAAIRLNTHRPYALAEKGRSSRENDWVLFSASPQRQRA
jgi:chemotaxis protein MotA